MKLYSIIIITLILCVHTINTMEIDRFTCCNYNKITYMKLVADGFIGTGLIFIAKSRSSNMNRWELLEIQYNYINNGPEITQANGSNRTYILAKKEYKEMMKNITKGISYLLFGLSLYGVAQIIEEHFLNENTD